MASVICLRTGFEMTACLARSWSPLVSTTHSRSNGDFPALGDWLRIGRIVEPRLVSARSRFNFRSRLDFFVSAFKSRFPSNGDRGSKRLVRRRLALDPNGWGDAEAKKSGFLVSTDPLVVALGAN